MNFLEKLRQQIMAEGQQRQQLVIQQKAKEEAKRQKEEAEKEFHRQRRKQAKAFWQESGVGILVAELGELLTEAKIPGIVYHPEASSSNGLVSRGFSQSFVDYTYPSSEHSPISPTDPDCVFDQATWDIKDEVRKNTKRNQRWNEREEKFLVAETRPDGNIVFHARKTITIPQQGMEK